MPEIKQNFTGGKMNKDLDERLIPNGQYRDAMNIQVSTSEGSDVGTAQNILGNSLVTGPSGIGVGASCVGSIADEKNDRLYWFISESDTRIVDLIDQKIFEPQYTRIINRNMIVEYDVKNEIITPVFVDDTRVSLSAQGGGVYNCPATALLDMLDVTGIEVGMYVHGIDTNGDTTFSSTVTSITLRTSPTPHQVNLASNPCDSYTATMWYIFSWHPSPTDSKGILNFKRGEYITGINIIDDMLFWTDNTSEPKKINISRCKAGTPSFNTQTKLINDSQGIDINSDIKMRGDHIAVIKKSPPISPIINLESERDPDLTYTGVMRITPPTSPVAYYDNPSSFTSIWSHGGTNRHDFSGLKVGDTFLTEIETDIDGNSGFTLDWKPGDIVWFKEFENGEPPRLPLIDYRIKAKIKYRIGTNSSGAAILGRYTDSISELLENGDFITPHSSGVKPDGWTPHAGSGLTYSAIDNKLVFDNPHQYWKIRTTDDISIAEDGEYKVEFTLSDVEAGQIAGYLVVPNTGGGSQVYRTAYYNTNGTHTETLTLSGNSASGWNATPFENKFFLQTVGNGQVDGYDYPGVEELVDTTMASSSTVGTTRGTHTGGDAWEANPSGSDVTEVSFDHTKIDDTAHANATYSTGQRNPRTIYLGNIQPDNLMNGARYELDLEVTLVSQEVGFTDFIMGISTSSTTARTENMYFTQADFDSSSSTATKTLEFNAKMNNNETSMGKIDVFIRSDSIQYHPIILGGIPTGGSATGMLVPNTWTFQHTGQQFPSYNSGGLFGLFWGNRWVTLDLPQNPQGLVPQNPQGLVGAIITDPGGFIPANTTVLAVTEVGGAQLLELSAKAPIPGGNQGNHNTVNIGPGTQFTFEKALGKEINSTFGASFVLKANLRKERGFTGKVENVSVEDLNSSNARAAFEITDIDGVPPTVAAGTTELKYAIDLYDEEERIFEFKFPRFATRYKYEDGEYSATSPFSEIAFLPGSFDYHPKKGYNLGMTNRLQKVKIVKTDTHVPDDVVSVDILYKDESSPNIYIVDTIKPNKWPYKYSISSEITTGVLPSNQLLRPWDNVPRKALAQDIIGNRVVYANYLQGYDLTDTSESDYLPDLTFDFTHNFVKDGVGKSIKSLKEYQLGIVFADEYGRETPVISNQNTVKKLGKKHSDSANQISVNFTDSSFPMKGMKYFKFFVKETSGEYYNMAMDRFWDAEDEHVWVSFPSCDSSKIDLDTFLILKKGAETDEPVKDSARYKVIAIENEAPDFIKTRKKLVEEREHTLAGGYNIFGDSISNGPIAGQDSFLMNYEAFVNGSGSELHELATNRGSALYVEFTKTSGEATSNRYKINSLTSSYIKEDSETFTNSKYSVKLDKDLGEDVDFITDGVKIVDTTVVKIYSYETEHGPEFDGRFFVKLINNDVFNRNIAQNIAAEGGSYKVLNSKKLYYLKDNHVETHAETITGLDNGLYSSNVNTGGGNFGRYAPFFRNYDTDNDSEVHAAVNGQNAISIGQYKFGTGNDWYEEFKLFTSSGNVGGGGDFQIDPPEETGGFWRLTGPDPGTVGNLDRDPEDEVRGLTKIADDAAPDEQVWFIDGGNYTGRRTYYTGSLHWQYISGTNNTNEGISSTNNDYSTMNIGMGGIYDSEINHPGDGGISFFFIIGHMSGNTNYQDVATKNFVDKLSPSRQFRFREDPNANIYTIQPNVADQRVLRYNQGNEIGGPKAPPVGVTHHTGAFPWSEFYHDDTKNAKFPRDEVAQLSTNFSKNWLLRIKNQNETNTHKVEWDPTNDGDYGPITNGLSLEIAHSATAAPVLSAGAGMAVKVDSLNVDVGGITHRIVVGMILTSHSDGTTEHTDGTSANEDWLAIWKIEKDGDSYNIFLTGYKALMPLTHDLYNNIPAVSENLIFEQPAMNGYSEYSANRINANAKHAGFPAFSISNPGLMAIGYNIEFIEPAKLDNELVRNPAIWETEPKESADLDVYYEVSGLNPIELNDDTKNLAIPIGSTVSHVGSSLIPVGTTIDSVTFPPILAPPTFPTQYSAVITLSESVLTGTGYIDAMGIPESLHRLKIIKPDGSSIDCSITEIGEYTSGTFTNEFAINTNLYSGDTTYNLNWSNCYSFGNGVESNRIRDGFNLPYILNGVKVSTTLDEGEYKEERRKHGLIYSGIYNSTSGINNLNQFIMAERITKDINPIYGGIQKLHARDSDLITLCEDKILKIQSNKDALYNADGNIQLTATNAVLGQAIPFVGEYGISKNPESFVSEAYRSYFTDKQRGAVMRLSKDGLTPISDHGMKDWFRDNLKLYDKLIGSYDDRDDEYNLTLRDAYGGIVTPKTISFREDVTGWVSFKSFVPEYGISCANDYFTMLYGKLYKHYDESKNRNTFYDTYVDSSINVILNKSPEIVKSFHTLDYEGSQSKIEGIKHVVVIDNIDHLGAVDPGKYFYIWAGDLDFFKSMIRIDLQDGYDNRGTSTVDVKQYRGDTLVNSGLIKLWFINLDHVFGRWHTDDLSFSGDFQIGDIITTEQQEKVISPFNSNSEDGWYVDNIITNKQEGSLKEFIEKEGKWFNYIKGINSDLGEDTNFGSFGIQGIGIVDKIKPKNIVDINRYTAIAPGFDILFKDTVSWDGISHPGTVPSHPKYLSNIMRSQDMVDGNEYTLTLKISNYSGTGSIGVSNSAGVSGAARLDASTVDGNGYGIYTENFFSNGDPIDLFGRGTNSAIIDVSVANYPTADVEFVFDEDINSSLQIGDTLYSETSTEVLGENLMVDLDESNWTAGNILTAVHSASGVLITANSAVVTDQHPSFWSNTFDLVDGKEYQLDIVMSDYNNNGDTSKIKNYIRGMVPATWQVPNPTTPTSPEYRPLPGEHPEVIEGKATYSFVFDRSLNKNSKTVRFQIELTNGDDVSKNVTLKSVTLREFNPGKIFGFTRLESNNIQKCGIVTGLAKSANILENQRRVYNTITVDSRNATSPSESDYILFSKNQVINTSNLLGYYAEATFKNNSKDKAELFSVSSEVTESSK